MKLKYFLSVFFTLTIFLTTKVLASEYWIKVSAESTGRYTVEATIDSNIPEEVTLSATLSLRGQKPDEVFIGTNFKRIPFSGEQAIVQIDGQEGSTGNPLPAGEYDVEVAFHPRWKENRSIAELLKITESIRASQIVSLEGSGQSSADAVKKEEGQLWALNNIYSGVSWDQGDLVRRFGEGEYIEDTRLNPAIIKNYYFESIDMTITVNADKRTIITLNEGRKSE